MRSSSGRRLRARQAHDGEAIHRKKTVAAGGLHRGPPTPSNMQSGYRLRWQPSGLHPEFARRLARYNADAHDLRTITSELRRGLMTGESRSSPGRDHILQ